MEHLQRDEEIVNLYKEGHNTLEISEKIGIHNCTVSRVLKKRGVPMRTMSQAKRTYRIDDSIFEKIDTKEKAYWLGFLYADGYNSGKDVKLTLSIKDQETIERFRLFLNSDKPLRYEEHTDGRKYVKFVIENKKITECLTRLGCIPAKTHKLSSPPIDSGFMPSFILGYFDGDGSFTNNWIQITSNKDLLDCFFVYLSKHLSLIKFFQRHPNRCNQIYDLRIWRKQDIIQFYKLIYMENHDLPYMSRKHDSILRYITDGRIRFNPDADF